MRDFFKGVDFSIIFLALVLGFSLAASRDSMKNKKMIRALEERADRQQEYIINTRGFVERFHGDVEE